jgi:hypothetical protein
LATADKFLPLEAVDQIYTIGVAFKSFFHATCFLEAEGLRTQP